MTFPFAQPQSTSTGGAGGGARGGISTGMGRVAVQDPPRNRQFPWPLPYSAMQGGVGGAGGSGRVQVVKQIPNFYQQCRQQWPYQVPSTGWIPFNPVMRY